MFDIKMFSDLGLMWRHDPTYPRMVACICELRPIRIMVRRVESMTKHNREAAAFIVHLALDLTCLSMVSQGKVWTKKV
jgi:hypothetical protein